MKQIFWVAAAVAGLAVGSLAQPGPDPAALTALRLRYQALLQEAEGPPRSRWLTAMEALERQKVMDGDFDAAAALRERRLALQKAPGTAGAAQTGIILRAATAKSGSGVDFPDAKKEVGRFRRPGAVMEWELPGQTPGTYQVNLVCGVMGAEDRNALPDPLSDPRVPLPPRTDDNGSEATAGGVVEFRKLTNLKEGGALLRRTVRSTGGWTMMRTLPLGIVELDSKIVKFSLRAADAHSDGLMDFQSLELIPLGRASAGPGPPDPAGLKTLARLKEVYQKQFADQTKTITAKYLKSLGDLEVVASRSRDNESLALVRQEKKRFERGSAASSAEGPGKAHVLPVTEKLYMLIRGEAKLTNQGDYLTRMRPANACEVTWKLAGLGVASGTYTVEVDCRLTPEHGGTAVLATSTPGGAAGPPLDMLVAAPKFSTDQIVTKRKPDGSPGTSTTSTFTVGKLTIPKGAEYLVLRVTSLLVPDGALLDLKSLRLTPVAPDSP